MWKYCDSRAEGCRSNCPGRGNYICISFRELKSLVSSRNSKKTRELECKVSKGVRVIALGTEWRLCDPVKGIEFMV